MSKIYAVNENSGKKYLVVKLDKKTNQITLRGAHGDFVEPYSKERFISMGYKVVKVEEEEDEEEDA